MSSFIGSAPISGRLFRGGDAGACRTSFVPLHHCVVIWLFSSGQSRERCPVCRQLAHTLSLLNGQSTDLCLIFRHLKHRPSSRHRSLSSCVSQPFTRRWLIPSSAGSVVGRDSLLADWSQFFTGFDSVQTPGNILTSFVGVKSCDVILCDRVEC